MLSSKMETKISSQKALNTSKAEEERNLWNKEKGLRGV